MTSTYLNQPETSLFQKKKTYRFSASLLNPGHSTQEALPELETGEDSRHANGPQGTSSSLHMIDHIARAFTAALGADVGFIVGGKAWCCAWRLYGQRWRKGWNGDVKGDGEEGSASQGEKMASRL